MINFLSDRYGLQVSPHIISAGDWIQSLKSQYSTSKGNNQVQMLTSHTIHLLKAYETNLQKETIKYK